MKRFARALVAILSLAVFGSVMSLVPQRPAAGAGSAPVNITSPLPLPVTGNVSAAVNGTVAAQQSGNWNVGITGTPNVSVGNYPATLTGASVPVSGSVNANVTFPPNLPVHNLDDRGRNPYQSFVDMTGKCPVVGFGGAQPECFFNFVPVPAGHRLVAQHVSGIIQTTGLPPFIQVGFAAPGLFSFSYSFLAPFVNLNGIVLSSFDQQVLVFYDQNQVPSVVVTPGSGTFSSGGIQVIALTGYLLDCDVASCEPIAQ